MRALVTERDRDRLFRDMPFDTIPATDDNPFYFVERARPGQRAGLGVIQLQTLLFALIALIVPFLLVPVIPLLRRAGEELHPSGAAALAYFSLIGVAFMGVEIELFHVFALLLGSPAITFAVVLASLLLSSGAGSYPLGAVEARGPADPLSDLRRPGGAAGRVPVGARVSVVDGRRGADGGARRRDSPDDRAARRF